MALEIAQLLATETAGMRGTLTGWLRMGDAVFGTNLSTADVCAICFVFLADVWDVLNVLPPFRWITDDPIKTGKFPLFSPPIPAARWKDRLRLMWWASPLIRLLFHLSVFCLALYVLPIVVPVNVPENTLRNFAVQITGVFIAIYSAILGMGVLLLVAVGASMANAGAYNISRRILGLLGAVLLCFVTSVAHSYKLNPFVIYAALIVVTTREVSNQAANIVRDVAQIAKYVRDLIRVLMTAEFSRTFARLRQQWGNTQNRMRLCLDVALLGLDRMGATTAAGIETRMSQWQKAAALTKRIHVFATSDWESQSTVQGDPYCPVRKRLLSVDTAQIQIQERTAFDALRQDRRADLVAFAALALARAQDVHTDDYFWQHKGDALEWLRQISGQEMTVGPTTRIDKDAIGKNGTPDPSGYHPVSPVSGRILHDIARMAHALHESCERHLDSLAVELIEVMLWRTKAEPAWQWAVARAADLIKPQTQEFNKSLDDLLATLRASNGLVSVPPDAIPVLQALVSLDAKSCESYCLSSVIEHRGPLGLIPRWIN